MLSIISTSYIFFYSNQYGIETSDSEGFQGKRGAFNRTSMESKLCIRPDSEPATDLLLEPVWNRNALTAFGILVSNAFYSNQYGIETLIRDQQPPNGLQLLLEPVWNRNSITRLLNMSSRAFTRTSMESKPPHRTAPHPAHAPFYSNQYGIETYRI